MRCLIPVTQYGALTVSGEEETRCRAEDGRMVDDAREGARVRRNLLLYS